MILQIFDKVTRNRVGLIRTYDYAHYTDEFDNIGLFKLSIPTSETSLENLTLNNFILFDKGVVGIIKHIKESETEDTAISVDGYLSNYLLSMRSIPLTERYNMKITQIARQMVTKHFINPANALRRIDFIHLSENEKYIPESEQIELSETGVQVREAISSMFLPYHYGFEMHPVIENYNEQQKNSNLNGFEFRVLKPADRSINNTEGNRTIVFSFDLNNVKNLSYEEDEREYCNIAIVASEGVGTDRKVIEVGDTSASGYDRNELYIDARDIQSEDSEGNTISNAELENAMRQRGLQYLELHKRFISFEGNVLVDGSNKYIYGEDFYKGDYVSVKLRRKNEFYKVQIVSVAKTISDGTEYFDVAFGYDILSASEIINRKG